MHVCVCVCVCVCVRERERDMTQRYAVPLMAGMTIFFSALVCNRLILNSPTLLFFCIPFCAEAFWLQEEALDAANLTTESSGSVPPYRAANMPRRYRFKGKSNLISVCWCKAVDKRLHIPHTTLSVLRRHVRIQFSHTVCPQCRIRGQRKPRGCNGSESNKIENLEAITPRSKNIIRKYFVIYFALQTHMLSNPKTIHDPTSIYNMQTQENFQIPNLLG